MASARAKKETELQVVPSEAREHRLRLGEMNDSQVVQASLDGDPRAFGELVVSDWTLLHHADLKAANTAELPENVQPVKVDGARMCEDKLSLQLPPASWSVVTLAPPRCGADGGPA